jgi:hypothetical protein
MPNGIHTAVQPVQPPGPHPPFYTVVAEAQSHKLGKGDDPMLPRGKCRNPRLGGGLDAFPAHTAGKSSRTPDSPPTQPPFATKR